MYGIPSDPTFNHALLNELRAKGYGCQNCQHNIVQPAEVCGTQLSVRRQCRFEHPAWPQGPCIRHKEPQ